MVPPALLEFSRGVMRSTSNSTRSKPVVTLDIDHGVLIATPTTIKVIVIGLKYVEACEILTDVRRRANGVDALLGGGGAVAAARLRS